MIRIVDKANCCGCMACEQKCPKKCIKMVSDVEGFLYPQVDADKCIDCGLCNKVCPIINENEPLKTPDPYIYQTPDANTLQNSSSGGAFTEIAKKIISRGGVVFGAKFDDQWNVVHDYAQTNEELVAFQGSKYVQSYIGESYKNVERFLREGKLVLFSGTPCQVQALKLFLRKEYDNLVTLDVVCHGVPSPMIWRDYLAYINPKNKKITHINLRDKKRGWARYSYLIEAGNEVLYDDYAANSEYLRGFIDHLYLRPSCHSCPAKKGKSNSDITLADCWGVDKVHPGMNNNTGLSAIMLNSIKAKTLCKEIVSDSTTLPHDVFLSENPSYHSSAVLPKWRETFWQHYPERSIKAISYINKLKQPSLIKRLLLKVRKIVK